MSTARLIQLNPVPNFLDFAAENPHRSRANAFFCGVSGAETPSRGPSGPDSRSSPNPGQLPGRASRPDRPRRSTVVRCGDARPPLNDYFRKELALVSQNVPVVGRRRSAGAFGRIGDGDVCKVEAHVGGPCTGLRLGVAVALSQGYVSVSVASEPFVFKGQVTEGRSHQSAAEVADSCGVVCWRRGGRKGLEFLLVTPGYIGGTCY